MKAQEIRVGNYIADSGGKQWQIDCWESHDKVAAKSPLLGFYPDSNIPMYGHPLTEYLDCLQPIPLTEEWLLKFGMEKTQDFVYVIDNELWIKLVLEFDDWNGMSFDVFIKGIYITNISFVHQLQNLYFSLTGTELEIKSE